MAEPPSQSSLPRLLALVGRELRAEHVDVLDEAAEGAVESDRVVTAPLPDGRVVAAHFTEAPADREALTRRLAVIVDTFGQSLLEGGEAREKRSAVPVALHEELRALAQRAQAKDAVVIDAHSPVVWGSANLKHPMSGIARTPEVDAALDYVARYRKELVETLRAEQDGPSQDVSQDRSPPDSAVTLAAAEVSPSSPPPAPIKDLTQRVLRHLRAHPALDHLRKGKPMREVVSTEDLAYLAHSFASIYLLVLVFDDTFDELRGERAMHDALPRVERLVLALPPLDPEPAPSAGVIHIRRRPRS